MVESKRPRQGHSAIGSSRSCVGGAAERARRFSPAGPGCDARSPAPPQGCKQVIEDRPVVQGAVETGQITRRIRAANRADAPGIGPCVKCGGGCRRGVGACERRGIASIDVEGGGATRASSEVVGDDRVVRLRSAIGFLMWLFMFWLCEHRGGCLTPLRCTATRQAARRRRYPTKNCAWRLPQLPCG